MRLGVDANGQYSDGLTVESTTTEVSAVLEDAAASENWALVQRVTASASFRKTTRLRDFLLYVCDRALKGDLESIREQQIGQHVFDRGASYNPADDNIVRVEARQLRKRLALYFETEGQDEPVEIVIPKGGYVPEFRSRVVGARSLGEQDIPDSAPATEDSESATASPLVRALVALAAFAVLAAGAWMWGRGDAAVPTAAVAAGEADGSLVFPWTAVFDRDNETTIVLADSILALLEDISRTRVTLDDYMNRRYIEKLQAGAESPELKHALGLVSQRQYTSIADVTLIQTVLRRAGGLQDRATVKYARNVNVREFKTQNFVLIGSTQSNPWVELFQPMMNYHFERDPETWEIFVRNKKPQGDEPATYIPGGRSGAAYSVIALLPNLTRTGSVLIIEGTMMEGTEAAGEFLNNPALLPRALAKFGLGEQEQPRYFEILLKSRAVGGTSKDTEPIAFRRVD